MPGSRLVAVQCLAVLWLAPALARSADPPPPDQVAFTLNGRAIQPQVIELGGVPGGEALGRLVFLNGLLMTLGPGETQDFTLSEEDDGLLYLAGKDGVRQPVAAREAAVYRNGERVMLDPLAKLTPEQLAGLRGLHLDCWPASLPDAWKRITPEHLVVTVTDRAVLKPARALPPLPDSLRFLYIQDQTGGAFQSLAALSALKELRFFGLFSYGPTPLDLDLLKNAKGLVFLDVGGAALSHPDALSSFAGLRYLNLAFCETVKDVEFVRAMPGLRVLNLQKSGVKDLSPLGALRELNFACATGAPVETLPKKTLPALKTLEILETHLSNEAVQAFATRHPQCQVLSSVAREFEKAFKDLTRAIVRWGAGPAWFRGETDEAKPLEEKDAKAVAGLVAQLKLDPGQSGLACACSEGPFVEFYRGEELVTSIAFRHAQQLEWMGGALGNWKMNEASVKAVNAWIAGLRKTAAQEP